MSYHKNFTHLSQENSKQIDNYLRFKKIENPEISKKTLRNIKETLKKLANFIKDKNFKDADSTTMQNFFESIENESYRSRDTYAMHIIPFYRWLQDLDQHTRPNNMKWFKITPQKTIRRLKDIHEKSKYFITPDDYKKMLTWGKDQYGQINAIWETYYLSGIRPEELPTMKIKDIENKEGTTIIIIPDSKTIQRRIPLRDTPYKLLEYLENHPEKNNPEAYLWFSFKSTQKNTQLTIDAIRERFRKMRKDLHLKETFNIKSFRKTRATITFQNATSLDELKTIAKNFGWTLQTAMLRQGEYNLTDEDEEIKKYCNQKYIEPTQKQLKEENKKLLETILNAEELFKMHFNQSFDMRQAKDGTLIMIKYHPDTRIPIIIKETDTNLTKEDKTTFKHWRQALIKHKITLYQPNQ